MREKVTNLARVLVTKKWLVNVISLIVLLVAVGQTTKVFEVIRERTYPDDFAVYYQAARAWRIGADPYGELGYGEVMRYLYPPASLWLFVPLTLTDLLTANYIWVLINYCLWGATIYLILRLRRNPVKFTAWALVTALTLQTFSVKFNLSMGQVNVLVTFLMVLAVFLAQEKRRDGWAGVLLALAGQVKIIPLLMLPYWVIRRRWRMVGSCLVTTVICLVIMGALTGRYLEVGRGLNAWQGVETTNYYDQSPASVLGRVWGERVINGWLTLGWTVGWYGWWCSLIWRRRVDEKVAAWGLLGIGLWMRAPVWPHYLVYLYPWVLIVWWGEWGKLVWSWLVLQLHVDGATGALTGWQRVIAPSGMWWWLAILLDQWWKLGGKPGLDRDWRKCKFRQRQSRER